MFSGVLSFWKLFKGVYGVWNANNLRQRLPGKEITARQHPHLRSRCVRDVVRKYREAYARSQSSAMALCPLSRRERGVGVSMVSCEFGAADPVQIAEWQWEIRTDRSIGRMLSNWSRNTRLPIVRLRSSQKFCSIYKTRQLDKYLSIHVSDVNSVPPQILIQYIDQK